MFFKIGVEWSWLVRSAGKKLEYDGHEYVIDELKEDSFKDVDIALFSAGGSISKKYGPIAVESGSMVHHPYLLIPLNLAM